jgi:gamma-butyrobetaine dioxygenase
MSRSLTIRPRPGSNAAVDIVLGNGAGPDIVIHPIWLRERCPLPQSLDALTQQRLFEPSELPLDLAITAARQPDQAHLELTFSDGHRSVYAVATLLDEIAAADGVYARLKPRPWDATLSPVPSADWRRLEDPAALAEMLEQYVAHGFVLLRNVPATPGTVLEVGVRFGQVRTTNFGALFDVKSKPDADDLAYTGLALAPHTDNPYREPVPGIQLLHCLVNDSPGGNSTLVDGFAVAAELKRRDPEGYAMLARTPVRYRYCDATTELVAWQTPIEHDCHGDIIAIHHSPRLDFAPLLPAQELQVYYRARRQLTELLTSERFEIRFRLEPGDLELFDNRRILHGRTAFDGGQGRRHLQGCYIDRDGPENLYRVLKRGRV